MPRAERIELQSNRELAPAQHLDETHGMRHLTAEERQPGPYARTEVAMALDLG